MTPRIGFSTLGCPEWPLAEALSRGEELGFDTFTLRVADGRLIALDEPPAELRRLRKLIAKSTLVPETLATSVRLLDDNAVHQLAVSLRMASTLGFERVRVFGGHRPARLSRTESAQRAANTVDDCLQLADDLAVGIALETHDAMSAASAVDDILRLVTHPRFGGIWDVVHTSHAGDRVEDAWRTLGTRLVEIQVKDATPAANGTMHPTLLGQGVVDWAGAVRLALGDGFDGSLVLEWERFWHPDIPPAEVALPHDRTQLMAVLNSR